MRLLRALALSLAVTGCALPDRDNPYDSSVRPVAALSVTDATSGPGECSALDSGLPVTVVARGRCVVLDASDSSSPKNADLVYTFHLLDPVVDEYTPTAGLGSGSSATLELSREAKESLPLDEIVVFGVTVRAGASEVTARASALFTNMAPRIAVSQPRAIPVGALPWSGSATVIVSFDAGATVDPDGDELLWCWTVPGREAGTPGDPETCDSTTERLDGVEIPTDAAGVHAAHVVVDDGTGPSAAVPAIATVRRPGPWVFTLAGSQHLDPFYEEVEYGNGAIIFAGAADDSTVVFNAFEYGISKLHVTPLSDPDAYSVSGPRVTGGSPTTFTAPNGILRHAVDGDYEGLAPVWVTYTSGSTVYYAGFPASTLEFFAFARVLTTASQAAPVGAGSEIAWFAAEDGIRAYEWNAMPDAIMWAAPFEPDASPVEVSERPGPRREAWSVWRGASGSRLARHVLTAEGIETTAHDLPPDAQYLAFTDEDHLCTFVPGFGIAIVDVERLTAGDPAAYRWAAAEDVVGLAGDPATGTCLAGASSGSVALFVGPDGSSRAVGQPNGIYPQFVDSVGAWWSVTADLKLVRSLNGKQQATGSAPVPYFPIAAPSYLDGGLWWFANDELRLQSGSGVEIRRIPALATAQGAMELQYVQDLAVEPDGAHAWVVNGDFTIWHVDLLADPVDGAQPAIQVPDFPLDLLGAAAGGVAWVRDIFSPYAIGTLQPDGTFDPLLPDWQDGVVAADGDLCVMRSLTVGTAEIYVDTGRLDDAGGLTGFATVAGTGVEWYDYQVVISASESACWLVLTEMYDAGSGVTRIWSVDEAGTATLEIETSSWLLGQFGELDLHASEDDQIWLVAGDESRTPTVVRFDRTATGWRETPYAVSGAYEFAHD